MEAQGWWWQEREREMKARLISNMDQSEHTKAQSLIWVQFVAPSQNNYSSNIKDHLSQITKTNIIIERLKHFENYHNVTQRHKLSIFCWENGTNRFV